MSCGQERNLFDEKFILIDTKRRIEKLEPLRNSADDPRIRMLNLHSFSEAFRCYACFHPCAVNCRKKKCGHENQVSSYTPSIMTKMDVLILICQSISTGMSVKASYTAGVIMCPNIEGVFNSKCIFLSRGKEPEIWNIIKFGTVLENVVFEENTHEVNERDKSITEMHTPGEGVPLRDLGSNHSFPLDALQLDNAMYKLIIKFPKREAEQCFVTEFLQTYCALQLVRKILSMIRTF
ncbi:hypothetical protein C5167_041031 [Papaver somniferum]|uniref:Large ribosomal subunit protein eL40 domain-containing protein n=1 Tax=Papaver somniferum TaxID=3469 RepID=A0A4Y7IGP5_PAPSO|nr:hypothetical protein C5167_041031 [Papaver somniferum]